MKTALALCRLSTEEQAAEGRAGMLRQRADIAQVAARHDLAIEQTVEIVDVSGTQVAQSPQFQALLRKLEEPHIAGLIVPAIDRLMRPDDFSSFAIFDVFLRGKKLLWTPQGEMDVAQDAGYMQAVMQSMMAGLDRRRILANTQAGKEQNRKRGRCANAKITLPQGIDFDFATGKWSWVEPYASRIRTAFERVLAGERNVRQLAHELGYHTDRTLHNQLRNPIWSGVREYKLRRGEKYATRDGKQGDRRKIARPEPLRVVIDIAPLVTREQFEQVEEILGDGHAKWLLARAAGSPLELAGLLWCECGEPLYSKPDRRNVAHSYYYCRSRHKPGQKGCGSPWIPSRQIEYNVGRLISEVLCSPEVITAILANVPQPADSSEELRQAEAELLSIAGQRQRLLHAYLLGAFTEAELAAESRAIESAERLWSQKARAARRPDSGDSIRTVAAAIATVFAEFEFLASADRKALLRQLVAGVSVRGRGIAKVTLRVATESNRTGVVSGRSVIDEIALPFSPPFERPLPLAGASA